MKISDILLEYYSGDLYHATYIDEAVSILHSDALFATPFMVNKTETSFSNNYYFYVSLSRSKYGSFHETKTDSQKLVLFVLDGDKLSRNFKTQPIDYWEGHITKNRHDEDEMEERIYVNKPEIKNISKYIKYVEVITNRNPNLNNAFFNLLKLCYDKNILTRVYANSIDFYRNKNFRIGSDLIKDIKNNPVKIDNTDIHGVDFHRDEFLYKVTTGDSDFDKLDKRSLDFLEVLKNGNMQLYKNEKFVHNFIFDIMEYSHSRYIAKIVSILRANKIKNIDGFSKFLINKYNKMENQNET